MHCAGGHSIRSTQPARLAPGWQSAGRARLPQRCDYLRAPVVGADLLAGGAAQRACQCGLLLSRWCVLQLLKLHSMISRLTVSQTHMLLPREWAALGSLGMVRAWQACMWQQPGRTACWSFGTWRRGTLWPCAPCRTLCLTWPGWLTPTHWHASLRAAAWRSGRTLRRRLRRSPAPRRCLMLGARRVRELEALLPVAAVSAPSLEYSLLQCHRMSSGVLLRFQSTCNDRPLAASVCNSACLSITAQHWIVKLDFLHCRWAGIQSPGPIKGR